MEKSRIAVVSLVVVLAAGLLFLWSLREKAATTVDPSAHALADTRTAFVSTDVDAAASAPAPTQEPADPSPTIAPSQTPAQSTAQSTTQATTLVGLQPLTADQEQRLEAFVDATSPDSDRTRDFEALVDHEAPDADWSDTIERRLADALRRHGARFNALHVGQPYCTRTVCRMLATGGFNSEAPNADWQRLVGFVMDDPALRNAFIDMNTTVSGDAKGIMYVTYLVRRTGDVR